jgi:hypothetical protein
MATEEADIKAGIEAAARESASLLSQSVDTPPRATQRDSDLQRQSEQERSTADRTSRESRCSISYDAAADSVVSFPSCRRNNFLKALQIAVAPPTGSKEQSLRVSHTKAQEAIETAISNDHSAHSALAVTCTPLCWLLTGSGRSDCVECAERDQGRRCRKDARLADRAGAVSGNGKKTPSELRWGRMDASSTRRARCIRCSSLHLSSVLRLLPSCISDATMKYIYRAMASGQNCTKLLLWHEKLYEKVSGADCSWAAFLDWHSDELQLTSKFLFCCCRTVRVSSCARWLTARSTAKRVASIRILRSLSTVSYSRGSVSSSSP